MSFNPRTRKGCDFKTKTVSGIDPVSIHAPVKDATDDDDMILYMEFVSIHAPVKDATRSGYRPRDSNRVSIHAPVKDAT